jgi:2-dehydro-3-deoxygluconokinase
MKAASRKPMVVSFGEPLIGIYPPKGCPVAGEHPLSMTWGGDTSNFALALAKLGHPAAYLTRIGSDDFGESFLSLWDQSGLDLSLIQRDRQHPTGLYFVSYRGDKHDFIYYRRNSAACYIDAEAVDWDRVAAARVLHLSSISQAIHRRATEMSFKLLAFARQQGITVSYDINFRPQLWDDSFVGEVVLPTLHKYVDILELTEEELIVLTGSADLGSFLRCSIRRPEIVALKKGARGCEVCRGSETAEVEAFAVEVADTVGAGDAFDAGLVAAVLDEEENLADMGRMANAVAACTCRAVGPLRSQPSRREMAELLGMVKL